MQKLGAALPVSVLTAYVDRIDGI